MGNWIIEFINGIISGIGSVIEFLIGLLPSSPFVAFQNVLTSDLLSMVNWFIPISEMIGILESWGMAIAGWYLVSVIMRIVKLRS